MNLAELVFGEPAEADLVGDEVAVYAGADEWSRARVRDEADALAERLAASGVRAGDRVAAQLPNGAPLIAALFGVWRAGATYIPLNPRLTDDEVTYVVDTVAPVAIVTVPEHVGRFAIGPAVVVRDPTGWSPVRERGTSAADGVGSGRDADLALIQFTSGTTGRPKPVLLRHSGVLELLDGVLRKLGASPKPPGGTTTGGTPTGAGADRTAPMPNLIPVSLSLWAGIYNVLFAFRVGAPVVVMDGFDTATFVELVRRFGIRSTVLPPAAMVMLSDDVTIDDLAPLRFVRSITAPLSPAQARRFNERFGVAVLNSYGQTEIGGEIIGWNAADSREHGRDKLGSIGRPHDGVQVRIVDDEGREQPVGERGELWVLTPAMSAGYADGADLSDRLSPDGWFRTGDLGWVDPEGFVWIDGRVSDMINRGGLKVFPAEVEEVLREVPGVADVAVVGVPDERTGEVPWAFVVPAGGAGGELDTTELEAHCRAHLAPYKVPARFAPVGRLPRNEIGKILVRELVEQATGPNPDLA